MPSLVQFLGGGGIARKEHPTATSLFFPYYLVTSPVLLTQLGLVYCRRTWRGRAVLPQVTREMGDSYLWFFINNYHLAAQCSF